MPQDAGHPSPTSKSPTDTTAPDLPSGGSLAAGSGLKSTDAPLVDLYDTAMLDLDGVVYVGAEAVDGAPERLAAARAAGMKLAFVTNNAARTPVAVARHLTGLGIRADAGDVVTSAQAAARMVARLVPPGSAVLVVGGEGLVSALAEHGLRAVSSADDFPSAVVQGFHPDVGWRLLCEGAVALHRGLPWIASNTDLTIPTSRGRAPGNGTLVAALRDATGREPEVAGKPQTPLFDETVLRVGSIRPLVVGDRLDTDIEGANTCGADSLLVLTGVSDLAALAAAEPHHRPTYVAADLSGLTSAHPGLSFAQDVVEVGGWKARIERGALVLTGDGAPLDGLRAVVAAAWRHHDESRADGRRDATLDLTAVPARLGSPPMSGEADSVGGPEGTEQGSGQ